jgi:PPOX class probable F420-dependent enzyme
MAVKIPPSHIDLIEGPVCAVLTTMMPDGQPQSSLVWCDYDGENVRVNTTRQRQKGKNIASNPKVLLLVIDTNDAGRWIEIRGKVELIETGAHEHLDEITRLYTGDPCFYGFVYPVEQKEKETRIICRIKTTKINLDAIHK